MVKITVQNCSLQNIYHVLHTISVHALGNSNFPMHSFITYVVAAILFFSFLAIDCDRLQNSRSLDYPVQSERAKRTRAVWGERASRNRLAMEKNGCVTLALLRPRAVATRRRTTAFSSCFIWSCSSLDIGQN